MDSEQSLGFPVLYVAWRLIALYSISSLVPVLWRMNSIHKLF